MEQNTDSKPISIQLPSNMLDTDASYAQETFLPMKSLNLNPVKKEKPSNLLEKQIQQFSHNFQETHDFSREIEESLKSLTDAETLAEQTSNTTATKKRGRRKAQQSNSGNYTELNAKLEKLNNDIKTLEESFTDMKNGILKQLFGLYGERSRSTRGVYIFEHEGIGIEKSPFDPP